MRIRPRSRGRGAATTVETALVMLPMLTLVFGIFEYCWLLANWNLLNNAAREGCRYALVHNTDSTVASDTQAVVNNYMAGCSSNFNTFTVSMSGTHNGVSTPVNNLVAGDLIAVSVSGKYRFLNIIPLNTLPTTLTISSSVTMVCEGAM